MRPVAARSGPLRPVAARPDPVHNSDRQVDLPGAALGALAALSGPSGTTLACPDPLWAGFWDPSRSNFGARTLKSEVFAKRGAKITKSHFSRFCCSNVALQILKWSKNHLHGAKICLKGPSMVTLRLKLVPLGAHVRAIFATSLAIVHQRVPKGPSACPRCLKFAKTWHSR